jgi:NADPH:quinone reductase-like Zn-dependent oxidoreductase
MTTEDKPQQEIGPPPSAATKSSNYFYNAIPSLGYWLGFGTDEIQSYRGKTALVTGASSGIGAAFAEVLASRGAKLILTAHPRDKEELSDVAQKLEREFGVDVETLVADLSETTGAQFIIDQVHPDERTIDVFVNNACHMMTLVGHW